MPEPTVAAARQPGNGRRGEIGYCRRGCRGLATGREWFRLRVRESPRRPVRPSRLAAWWEHESARKFPPGSTLGGRSGLAELPPARVGGGTLPAPPGGGRHQHPVRHRVAGTTPPGPGTPRPGTGPEWEAPGHRRSSHTGAGLRHPAAGGADGPGGGGGSIPMARIRARCVAAWVLAQGKSGLLGKYWTSSCMYRPEGNVMPPYSTWQPTEGRITPMASADHCAMRRLVDPRGDLLRGNPIVSTLLGVFGGPSVPSFEGGLTAVGASIPGPARPSPPHLRGPIPRGRAERVAADSAAAWGHRPCGAVVGFLTWLPNRSDSPSRTNDSVHFEENSIAQPAEWSRWADSPA